MVLFSALGIFHPRDALHDSDFFCVRIFPYQIVKQRKSRLNLSWKERQAFWKGVVAGILGSAAFFSGLVVLIYYMIQIVQAIK